MVYSSKDFESLWFLYQAEGLPKNISIEEFFDERSGKPITAQSTESTILLSTHGIERRIRRFVQ